MTRDVQDIDKESYYALSLLAIALSIFVISPSLDSGYISDDSWASIKAAHPSIKIACIRIYEEITEGFRSSGHFTILSSVLGHTVYFITKHNLVLYKLYILLTVIGNLILFGYFIIKVTKSRIVSLLSIMSLPLLFQFRNYHDPILSFVGQQQMILATLLSSLVFFVNFLEHERQRWLLLSISFYIMCLMMSENAYFLFLFHVLIGFSWSKNRPLRMLKASLPFILLSGLFIVAAFFIRHASHSQYAGTAINPNVAKIFITYLKQIYSSFPLNYFFANFGKTLIYDKTYIYTHIFFQVVFLISISSVLILYIVKRLNNIEYKTVPRHFPLLGLFLIFIPSMLISLSTKYQEELVWGTGYIPVYLSYYGISILLTSLIYLAAKYSFHAARLKYLFGIMFIIFYCIAVSLNYINNRLVVENLNYTFLYPRAVIEEAGKKGLFQKVGSNSTLLINGDHHWDGVYMQIQQQFYDLIAPKKFNDVVKIKNLRNISLDSANKSFYYLNYTSLSKDAGYAVLGKLEDLSQNEFSNLVSRDIYVYVKVPYYRGIDWDLNIYGPKISFFGKWNEKKNNDRGFTLCDYNSAVNLISSGIDWRLYQIKTENQINIESLSVNVDRQYVPSTHKKYQLNEAIYFRDSEKLKKGWSFPESDHTWSEGKEAVIIFQLERIPRERKQYNLVISAGSNGRQKVAVVLNGKNIGLLDYSGAFEIKKIPFDSKILYINEENTVKFMIPDAKLPGSGDLRVLGIYLKELMITDQN